MFPYLSTSFTLIVENDSFDRWEEKLTGTDSGGLKIVSEVFVSFQERKEVIGVRWLSGTNIRVSKWNVVTPTTAMTESSWHILFKNMCST